MTVVASGELELKLSQASLTNIERSINTATGKVKTFDVKVDPKATKKIEQDLATAGDKAGKASAQSFGKAFSGDLGKISGALGLGLLAGLGGAIAATTQFDKALSGVQAVANATSVELGQLRTAALEAGKATVFSASEAAKAEAELAKAGVSVKDILGGGLRGALDLAAAGQIDLAEAATIAAQALNIFNLEGNQTTHIADVLAAAANKSAADVQGLGASLRQGGLGAAQAGLSLEETAGALALFADNALIGSDAGTSLKTFLQRLVPTSGEAREKMNELGISFFDAAGNMLDLAGIADQLTVHLANLSEEQRLGALNTIFGSDAVRAASILYKSGAGGVRDYTQAVNDQGAAGRNAAIQLDNLAGDLEQLKGSIETALIQAGSGGTAALRGLAQAANSAVGTFIELPQPVQFAATAVAGIAGSALAAASAYGFLQPKVQAARDALELLGPTGIRASRALGLIGKAAGALGIAVAGITTLGLATDVIASKLDNGAANVNALTESLVDLSKTRTATGEFLKQFGGDVDDVVEKIVKFNKRASGDLGGPNLPGNKRLNRLFNFLDPKLKSTKKDLDALDDSLTNLFNSGTEGEEIAKGFWKEIKAGAAESGVDLNKLRGIFDGFAGTLANQRTQQKLANTELGESVDQATGKILTFAERASQLAQGAAGLASKFKAGFVNVGSAILAGLTQGLEGEDALKEFLKPFEDVADSIRKTLDVGDIWQKLEDDGKASIKALNKALEDQIKALANWQKNLRTIAARGGEDFALTLQKMGPEAAGLIEKIAEATAPEFNKLAENFRRAGELSGTSYAVQLETELKIVAALARTNGTETAVQLAAGVAGGIQNVTPDLVALVNNLAKQFNVKLPVSLEISNALATLDALKAAIIAVGGVVPPGLTINATTENPRSDKAFHGARASGGPFAAGRDYLVGERGREIVRFNTSGTVINNRETERILTGNNTVEQHITINEVTADPRITAFAVAARLGADSTR